MHLASDSPSFIPVHPQIRAIGPPDLHHAKGRGLDEKLEEIAAACRRYGIERLFVFGSALREDFRSGESDIDLQKAKEIVRKMLKGKEWDKVKESTLKSINLKLSKLGYVYQKGNIIKI